MRTRRVVAGLRRGGTAQPVIDIVVRRIEQRLELVEFGLAEAGKLGRREGPEDQIDLLEPPALGAEQ